MFLDPDKPNMGLGKKFLNIVRQAVYGLYDEARYASRARVLSSGRRLGRWLRDTLAMTDIRYVTQDVLEDYGHYIAELVDFDEISHKHGTNLISDVNGLIDALLGKGIAWIAPADFLGKRSYVRTDIPLGYDWADVSEAAHLLAEKGFGREGLVLCLARKIGMRCKEALLQDYHLLLFQAKTLGMIAITKGTKGGRGKYIERWVPVDDITIMLLEHAALLQGDWKSLVPRKLSLVKYRAKFYRAYNPVRDFVGLGRVHDLRAAYACERYYQITGYDAPVIAGERTASKEDDRNAREIISRELGHGRTCVLANYIGSAR